MDSGRKQSKWGPPGGGGDKGGPKSLMDMNFGGRAPNPGNFRGDRPPPRGPPNQNAPWMNQNRPYGPRGGGPGGPPANNAPWLQNQPPRGKLQLLLILYITNSGKFFECFYSLIFTVLSILIVIRQIPKLLPTIVFRPTTTKQL